VKSGGVKGFSSRSLRLELDEALLWALWGVTTIR
jgi:hypothetical protein